jgi:threonine dehydrogenase-like Zn-dependent dehydrogenase
LGVVKGYMGFTGVMGHEFVGRVLHGPADWKARRVVCEINCVCGRCERCTSGLSNHCPNRTVIGIDGHPGCFAEQIAVPVRNLHAVPDPVPDEQAVFVEPLAAAIQITRQVDIGRADRVVVLGAGRLGQLVARVLKHSTDDLLLVGRHEMKLQAAEKQGIRTAGSEQFSPNRDADVVVDATGSAEGFATAMQAVRPRGTIVLKSTVALGTEINLAPLVVDEITVVGSRCGPFPDALGMLAAGEVDPAALISRVMPLSGGPAVLDQARDPENLKVLVDVRR